MGFLRDVDACIYWDSTGFKVIGFRETLDEHNGSLLLCFQVLGSRYRFGGLGGLGLGG